MYENKAKQQMSEAFGTIVVSAGSLVAATYGIASLIAW